MISLKKVKQYCKDPIEWIENYQEAINDTEQIWDCHHRFETDHNMTILELQAMGFYFKRSFDELIFLPHSDHRRLHMDGENNPMYGKEGFWKGKEGPHKGHYHTEEAKQRMSDIRKGKVGENAPNYKFHINKEELYDLYVVQRLTLQKIAELYGCHLTTIQHKLKKYNIKK